MEITFYFIFTYIFNLCVKDATYVVMLFSLIRTLYLFRCEILIKSCHNFVKLLLGKHINA